jgi:hypothetical protein
MSKCTAEQFLTRLKEKLKTATYADYIKQSPEELADDIVKHAIVVVEGEMLEAKAQIGESKIGGCPDLPESFPWPCEEDEEDMPLAFLCQINLAEVHEHDLHTRLPQKGMLWFFSIADGDRAYSYEIDCDTTRVHFEANPGELSSRDIPDELADEEGSEIEERKLVFGPSVMLEEVNEDGNLESKRFDGGIESVIRETVRSLGGRSGVVRLLGHAHFFREENQGDFDPEKDEVLAEVDGYGVASHAFGEGSFTWSITKHELSQGKLDSAFLVFEPGT